MPVAAPVTRAVCSARSTWGLHSFGIAEARVVFGMAHGIVEPAFGRHDKDKYRIHR